MFLPSVCVHNNTWERKTSWSSAPVYYCERWTSATVFYCECKRKVKTGEAGNEAKAYASKSVEQFDTHCIPNENIVMETGGREAFVIGRSKVKLKKM